jgi:hypothetical protein
MARFSERIGVKPLKNVLQLESMDDDLRNGLWNVCYSLCLKRLATATYSINGTDYVCGPLWRDFFKRPIDEIPGHGSQGLSFVKTFYFDKADWATIYDFAEFLATLFQDTEFVRACNLVLASEMSGYRFVGRSLVPITNASELTTITEALSAREPFQPVRVHLRSSVDLFSSRKNPDYRNSIKESISAVEAISQIITGEDKATLGQALKKLEEKGIQLHEALKKSFSSLYGYTSDAEGIRHALLEESTVDFDDAKFMLVSCSAFVNYLAAKATNAGLVPSGKSGG